MPDKVDESYLLKDGDKFAQYRYKLTEFFIIIDGETDELPIERIVDMRISNYYEKAVFPLFKLGVVLEPIRYYKLLQNRDKVKFKIRIQSYYTTNDDPNNPSLLRDFINDTFVFFPDDDNIDMDVNLKDTDGLNELDQVNNYIELFLFRDIVTKLRSPVNYIFTGANMATVVSYLLYKAGVNKVLMSPFENSKVYDQVICPPMGTEKQLRFLNNSFGFHKKGTMIFFGFLNTYILNCKDGCTAYAKKEWQESKIFILDKTNTKSSLSGSFIRPEEEVFYTLIQSSAIDVKNSAPVENVLGGVNPTIVDMAAQSTSNNEADITGVSTKNKKILFNDSSNAFMGETQMALQKANGTVIRAVIENINIEAFKPNKKHSIVFEDSQMNSKFGGTYRIAESIFTFSHATGDFTLQAIVTFKKL